MAVTFGTGAFSQNACMVLEMVGDPLVVAVYLPPDMPQSFLVYSQNVGRHLIAHGIELVPFRSETTLPKTADVLWDVRSGGGNPPLEFLLGKQPLVVTVHGFAPVTLSGWDYFRTLKGVLMSRIYARQKLAGWQSTKDGVSAIVAVSHFTKQEIIRYIGFPEERIFVCHHGVDLDAFKPVDEPCTDRYFLHVSNGEPRKNIERIVAAFRRMTKSPDVKLILKLPKGMEHYREAGIDVVSGFLSDQDLAALYQGAIAFLFPSLYEGFGMPILEAMGCGCPVITSNVSACGEVAGEGAVVLNPYDEDEIADSMKRLLQDNDYRNHMIKKGMERLNAFSWAESSKSHALSFLNAAGKKLQEK
jgi:glycosyltransferase involved in cell wall biosynthesis